MFLTEDNEHTISGSDSDGSVGSDNGSGDGSGGSGSGGSGDGSGGSVDGSGGSDNGSGGSGYGIDNGSADTGNDVATNQSESGGNKGNVADFRPTRAERERRRTGVRLGGTDGGFFGRSGNNDSFGGGNDGSATATDETARDAGENVVRLGSRKQGKPKKTVDVESSNVSPIKLSEIKDLISTFISSIFDIPASALNQPHWKLSKEELKALTDAIMQYLDSMPKSKSGKVASFVSEHLPLLNLAMIGFFILSGRIQQTVTQMKIERAAKSYAQTLGSVAPATPNGNGLNISTPLDGMFS